MYKVLLVDDEDKIRLGLKSVVHWEELGFTIIGDVSNGLEALEFLDEVECPDVILSDIRMPVMDGIALLEAVQLRQLPVSFLILSGYDYFEYAKKALELGAVDYLLKPTKLPELQEKFKALKVRLDKKRDTAALIDSGVRQQQSAAVKRLMAAPTGLEGDVQEEETDRAFLSLLPAQLTTGFCELAVLAVQLFSQEAWEQADTTLLLSKRWSSRLQAIPVLDRRNRLLFVCWRKAGDGSVETLSDSMLHKLQTEAAVIIQDCSAAGLEAYVGISQCVPSGLEGVRHRYKEALEVLSTGFYSGAGTIQTYSLYDNYDGKAYLEAYNEQILVHAVEQGGSHLIADAVETMLKVRFSDSRLKPARITQACVETMLLLARNWKDRRIQDFINEQQCLQIEVYSIDQLKKWFVNMLLLLSDCLMDSREDSNSRIVKHIQKMVAEKYYEPITLHSIAESMYMNPDYLSRLFKKEIGTSFSDYLTLYRIDAAKGMLSDVSSKSYEVGYAVGYQNPSHFAKMFKKVTGYSVSQFRSNAENDR